MKKNSLQNISKKINNKAKIQENSMNMVEEYKKAKKILEKYSTGEEKTFTYTVGDLNAYLG
jgi:hypothetical protein